MVEKDEAVDESAFRIDRDEPAIADTPDEVDQARLELLFAAPRRGVVAVLGSGRTSPSRGGTFVLCEPFSMRLQSSVNG